MVAGYFELALSGTSLKRGLEGFIERRRCGSSSISSAAGYILKSILLNAVTTENITWETLVDPYIFANRRVVRTLRNTVVDLIELKRFSLAKDTVASGSPADL